MKNENAIFMFQSNYCSYLNKWKRVAGLKEGLKSGTLYNYTNEEQKQRMKRKWN